MDTLVIGNLVVGSQKECATVSIHHCSGEGPRVGLTWSSLLDLSTISEVQICGLVQVSEAHQYLFDALKAELLDT